MNLEIKNLKEDLALVKLNKIKNLTYGPNQNMKSNTEEIYVSENYFEILKNKIDMKKISKTIYVLPRTFFEKFRTLKKRKHLINVVG